MKPRRTSFAAPFVMVIAAGCGGGHTHSNPPGAENPPAPERMSADACRALSDGAACDGDVTSCSTQSEDGCGVQGYECIEADDGKKAWHSYVATCNPPPPTEPVAPVHDNPPPPQKP